MVFHVLATVNCAVMNIGMHVSFSSKALSGYMPSSGIAGSYGSSIFSFLRYHHTVSPIVAVPQRDVFQPQMKKSSLGKGVPSFGIRFPQIRKHK